MERAARWCPDATPSDREAAASRLETESALAAGLPISPGAIPSGWPAGAERDLLEAVEEIVRAEEIDLLDGIRSVHPLGGGPGPEGATCGTCAWERAGSCLSWKGGAARAPRIGGSQPACLRWEPRLGDDACRSCGACCREGYSRAPVRRGEPMLLAHPEWIRRDGRQAFLPRPGGTCVALEGDGSPGSPWGCRDYAARPRACADLAPGSRACLVARRRTGLSR